MHRTTPSPRWRLSLLLRGPRRRRRARLRVRRVAVSTLGLFALLVGLTGLASGDRAAAQGSDGGEVFVVPITGTIDLGLAPYLSRILDEAADQNAAAVLIEIDTPGGRLDAVLQMQDALLDSEVRTIAFVDRTAFSAGALVAIASEEIYMAPGAVMGAATPVDGATGETSSEKIVSAVRSTFRSTAEARGRDPRIAEAMVDPDVRIDGLDTAGQLLTLTTDDALAWGYADGVASTRAELLGAAGLAGAEVVETSPSLAEDAVRWVTDPIVASLLLIVGILLIVGDFLVEGVGVPAAIGAVLIAAFFWGHLLAGLAGWEDVALVVLGIALIAVELFVIPGFGVAGIAGIIALLAGVFLAMLGREIQTPAQIERAGYTVVAVLLALVAGLVALVIFLPRGSRLSGLVLQSQADSLPVPAPVTTVRRPGGWLRWFGGDAALHSDRRVTVAETRGAPPNPVGVGGPAAVLALGASSLAGRGGVAVTDLRPSGIAEIDGERVDVVSDGGYVAAGEPITVVRDEGYRRVVRRAAA
jgi:membrane-bound serine protease (ClpP class)